VPRSAATEEPRHEILGCLVVAYSLLGALSRVDPAAVDESLRRAIELRARVSRPNAVSPDTTSRDEGVGRGHDTGLYQKLCAEQQATGQIAIMPMARSTNRRLARA
jgi:hypothetical protein